MVEAALAVSPGVSAVLACDDGKRIAPHAL